MWYDVIGVIYRLIIIFLIKRITINGVTPRLIPPASTAATPLDDIPPHE